MYSFDIIIIVALFLIFTFFNKIVLRRHILIILSILFILSLFTKRYLGYMVWQNVILLIVEAFMISLVWHIYLTVKANKMILVKDNKIRILFDSVLILLGVIFFLFPLAIFNEPSGEFGVGVKEYTLVDEYRTEYKNASTNRVFGMKIFYPIDGKDSLKIYDYSKWIIRDDKYIDMLGREFEIPIAFLSHIKNIKSYSVLDGEISNEASKYPVVVISHGYMEYKEKYQQISEEIASRGYVVINIDHTYSAAISNLGNYTSRLPKSMETEDDFNQMIDLYKNDIESTFNLLIDMENGIVDSNLSGRLILDENIVIGKGVSATAILLMAEENEKFSKGICIDPDLDYQVLNKEIELDKELLIVLTKEWLGNEMEYSFIENITISEDLNISKIEFLEKAKLSVDKNLSPLIYNRNIFKEDKFDINLVDIILD